MAARADSASDRPASNGDVAKDAVRAVARAQERDRYLAALLAPYRRRDDLIALAAFAGELQRIPGYVSQPLLGEMRLQWWRDTIEAGMEGGNAGAAGGHPVAQAICDAARRRGIEPAALIAVIDAQSARLEDMPFATQRALENNLAAWDGGLFVLAWRILTDGSAQGAEGETVEMLGRAGIVYGLCRVIADAGVERLQGRTLVPADIRGRHGATIEFADPEAARTAWSHVAADLARRIEDLCDEVRQGYRAASPEARLAALPVALVRPYLALSRRFDIADAETADIRPLTRVVRLWAGYRFGLTGL